jgi:hypothetical protein
MDQLKGAVVVRFRAPKVLVFSVAGLSLSRSSTLLPLTVSLKSVLRRVKAGGGVTVLGSSLVNLEVAGDGTPVNGKYASPVSRRRLPGRFVVGDDTPYGAPLPEIDVLRKDRPSFGVPSLFMFCAGGLMGELTDVL